MTSKMEVSEEDLIRECANSPFESLVILAFKEMCKTIKNHEERIAFLENKMVLDKGGK